MSKKKINYKKKSIYILWDFGYFSLTYNRKSKTNLEQNFILQYVIKGESERKREKKTESKIFLKIFGKN